MLNHRKIVFRILLVVVVIIGLFLLSKSCTNYLTKEEKDLKLIEAINDSLSYYKNKEGELVAKIRVLETSNLDYFTSLEVKDEEIKNLQEIVKKQSKNLSSATTIKTITKIDTIVKVEYKDGKEQKFPFDFEGWVYGRVRYMKDSIGMTVNIQNELVVLHKKDEKGHYVEVFDRNPYTTTEAVRSYYKDVNYNKKPITKRWGIGPNLSYGVNHKGEFLPYVGIGIQYNLINF